MKYSFKKMMLVAWATTLCGTVGADTAFWIPTGSSTETTATYQWGAPANWQDSDENVLSVAPTNGQDIVFGQFMEPKMCRMTISTGVTVGNDSSAVVANGAVDPIVAAVSGGSSRHEIRHAEPTSAANQPQRYFRIAQAKDFLGFWRVANGKAFFSLESTVDNVAEMGSLLIDRRPRVAVPTAGTTAILGETTGIGALQKTGAGELRIGVQSTGCDSIAYVSEGTATFAGSDGDALAGLISSAAFHLDASIASTLTISNGDGYAWVRKWTDADGRPGRWAQPDSYSNGSSIFMSYVVPAFICETKSPTGLPLVSFGSGYYHPGLGPSNVVMALNSRLSGVREVFYAVETPGGANGVTVLGDTSNYHYVSEDHIFSDYELNGVYPIRSGEVRINGARRVLRDDLDASALKRCYVVSAASTVGLSFNLLGCDRHYMARSGGSMMGELLAFTNVLTRAERAQINRYLVAKWVSGADYDAKLAVVSAGAKIGVADGRTSRIRELSAPNGSLVKTGGGELRTSRLGPVASNCVVRVEGGTLGFDRLPDEGDEPTAPADGAHLWLDSTKADTLGEMTSEYAAGKTLVSTWRDCRAGVNRTAFCPTTNGTWNCATRVAIPTKTTFKGKTVLDFGTKPSSEPFSDLSRMRLATDNTANVYAGFMVLRNLASHFRQYFGSYGMDLYRNTSTMMASNYENARVSSGTWTIDGEMIDPISTAWSARYAATNDFQVFAFSLDTPVDFSQIFQDRYYGTYPDASGRAQVGEVILYRRKLTDRERRDTEAYLMRKWLGKTHPDRDQGVAIRKMTFDAGAPAVVDADVPIDIATMTFDGDSLIKRGAGKATIDVLSVTNHLDGMRVDGGELELSMEFDFSSNLLFHFDASDADSLVTTVTGDANGTLQTNVIKWLDVRQNGLYAESAYNAGGNVTTRHCTTNPTLQQMSMPDGVKRSAVDFGVYNDSKNTAGMLFHTTSAYGSAVSGVYAKSFDNVREIHTIYAKPASGSMTGPYAGTAGTGLSYYSAYWAVLSGSASDVSKNGYIATNGVQCAYNTALTRGRFYLLSLSPTADTSVSAISIDRGTGSGGGSMSEMIGFSKPLGDVQRRFLQETLMAKWLGEPKPAWKMRSLSVASGSRLTIANGTPLSVETFSGGGVVSTAGGVQGISSLSFAFRSADDYEKLEVDGPLAFADDVDVTITAPESAEVVVGDYPIITATGGIANANVRNWTLTVSGFPKSVHAALKVVDGAVLLRLWTVGTGIILR